MASSISKPLSLLLLLHLLPLSASCSPAFCPTLYISKVPLSLPYQPGYVSIIKDGCGNGCESLGITSFFNVYRYLFPFDTFYEDLVSTTSLPLNVNAVPQKVSSSNVVWPSNAVGTPPGFVPFRAIAIPQGFLRPERPGRLSLIDLDTNEEYIVFQSTQSTPPQFSNFEDAANAPRFFTNVSFDIDCNGDGLKDIVTAASSIRGIPQFTPPNSFNFVFYPPSGELWCLINPGAAINKNVEWQRKLLYGGMTAGYVGPDLNFQVADFDSDGIPEIVATHTFLQIPKLSIYGPMPGQTWASVDASNPATIRVKDIKTGTGSPFNVEAVDLNMDGNLDILVSFNAPDNCTETATTAGSVRAYEQPDSGDIFGDNWVERIIFDGIFGAPNLPIATLPGNQAPGQAKSFRRNLAYTWEKPWILLSGQDSGRVWILKPCRDWSYQRALVFDIDDHYGPGTTSTPDASGILSVSIGSPAITYGERFTRGTKGIPFLYIPVYQKREIFVISLVQSRQASEVLVCPPEVPRVCLPSPAGAP